VRKLFSKNGDAEIAGLDALDYAELQDFHDFFDRRPGFQCCFDVTLRSERIHVRVGCIERDADEFDFFRREHAAGVNGYVCGHELIDPDRSKSDEGIPGVVPLLSAFILSIAGVFSPAFFKRFARPTPAASKDASLASSKTIGPPRAQEWMDRMEAIFSTIRISSRVASS
jgi:hypothetical protein